jgi:hypothetical protein
MINPIITQTLGQILGRNGSAEVAQQAMAVRQGSVEIVIEDYTVVFRVIDRPDLQPVVIDLGNNKILNATFPVPETILTATPEGAIP